MNEIFDTMTSLGFAVALSPEILLLGLWLAASAERGRQKVWAYCAGGIAGLLMLVVLGSILGHEVPTGPSWTRFFIRISLCVVMVLLGLKVLLKKSHSGEGHGLRYNAERVRPIHAFCLGLLITVANIKIITLGISSGKNWFAFEGPKLIGLAALALFFAIGSLPLVVPAVIETLRTGFSAKVMAPCTRFFERYGKWVVAVVCFIMGIQFLRHAIQIMP